ncbi:MAG: S8 family serine peptidase [Ignavibacteriales bacterium]|nr:S8 family serine peptidase [Ignavibacteriales bacterium]
MRSLIIILFFYLISSSAFAQEKYLIYFKDKGDFGKETLSKTTVKVNLAKLILSEKSIERRRKSMGNDFITFQDLPISENYVDQLRANNVQIVHKLKWFNAVSAIINSSDLSTVKNLKFVDKIEKVKKLKSITPITDAEQSSNLNKINATDVYDYGQSLTQYQLSDIPQVHDLGFTGEGITIGILDSGFEWKKLTSLKDRNVIAEHDFIYNDNVTANDSKDTTENNFTQHNHGTAVFSILAGFDEGNIVGPAFNSNFILAKTEYIPSETHAEEDNYAAALEWMDSIGVDITTSSLGYSEFDATDFSYTYADMNGSTTIVTKAAEFAFERGIVVITSAGNEGNNSWYYITAPGDGFNTLTIGAVTSTNLLASFSSHGPTFDGRIKPEVVAMGSNVMHATTGKSPYSFGSGTSYSAPIVAGITGLLMSAHPHLTNKQVRSIIMNSGDNLANPNNDVGYGLVSALKAIEYPNLETVAGITYVRKIFSNSANINENTIEIVTESGTKLPMTKIDNLYFRVELPVGVNEQNNRIYFTYKDLQNNEVREPSREFYNLYIDQSLVSVNEENTENEIPTSFTLSQNYPNPFNPVTTIQFAIPQLTNNNSASVQLKVYDILGSEITTLVNETKSAGNYSVEFNANNLPSEFIFIN